MNYLNRASVEKNVKTLTKDIEDDLSKRRDLDILGGNGLNNIQVLIIPQFIQFYPVQIKFSARFFLYT